MCPPYCTVWGKIKRDGEREKKRGIKEREEGGRKWHEHIVCKKRERKVEKEMGRGGGECIVHPINASTVLYHMSKEKEMGGGGGKT